MTIDTILSENARRNALLSTSYDPVAGTGCTGRRVEVVASPYADGTCLLPAAMLDDPDYHRVTTRNDWQRLRCRHDFEYWCVTCVRIKDKMSGRDIPFRLNAPQRRVAAMLEEDRVAGRPLRLIMLKARQWGGSTLVQMYMAWIQTVHLTNWHSLICAHVKDTSATIRGMYSKMLSLYPAELWQGDEPPCFRPFERSTNVRTIAGRGCRVTVGSSENQEAVRGADYAMAHLSEVAFWSDSDRRSPEQFIRAVCGAINTGPLTLIVMESTANGVGNYFHSEWVRSREGRSDKRAVMVPWYEIEIYRMPVTDPERLWLEMDDYERRLWNMGLTLEMIQWYHCKRREYPSHTMMQAEYPTDDVEAFTNTGHNLFSSESVERLRAGCTAPVATGDFTGPVLTGRAALSGMRFVSEPGLQPMKLWCRPDTETPGLSYIVSVDVGGRSAMSDYSVISVFLRRRDVPGIEVAAQWRGHCDHDILAWKSAAIARWYRNAMLIIESNTLETEDTDGDHSLFILNQIADAYTNLYTRNGADGTAGRVGFHTNRSTKAMIINLLIAAVRDGTLIERDHEACNELALYEVRPNGSFAARAGHHDDILITRALALHAAASMPPPASDDLLSYVASRCR